MFAAMRAPAARRFAGLVRRAMITGSLTFTMALAVWQVDDAAILAAPFVRSDAGASMTLFAARTRSATA
jgi:hypothetical protein